MKYLLFLFLLSSNGLYGQTSNDIQNTVMSSMSARATFFSDMKRVTLDVEPPRQPWVCCGGCIIMSQFDDALEGLVKVVPASSADGELKKGSIFGRLLDGESKEPILFATVVIYENDKVIGGTTTDLDGNYRFNNLNPGIYDVGFTYIGYQEQRVTNIEIEIRDHTHSSLHFFDIETQDDLIGVNVLIYKEDKYVTGTSANVNGLVSLNNLESGSYRFQFRYLGYEAIDTVLQIDALQEFEIPMRTSSFELKEVVIIGYDAIVKCVLKTNCQFPLVKITEETAKDKDQEISNFRLNIFPNPSSDYVQLNIDEETSLLLVSDQGGRVIYKKENPAVGLNKISVFDYPAGTYFVSLMRNNDMLTEKLIVVK